MLRVTFKNVGQGDSIILEWIKDDNSEPGIGIIDCNLMNNNQNPILNYIIERNYIYIDFLLLSHPHADHFSGFLSLINYCTENGIRIGCFYHTCSQVPAHLQAACSSITDEEELRNLFLKVLELSRSGSMPKQTIDHFSRNIILNKDIQIQCISPSEVEKDYYITNKKYIYNQENAGNHYKANFLSTVLKVHGKDWYILLTADATIPTFKRLIKESAQFQGRLLLGQSAHHGSKHSHDDNFWKARIKKDRGVFAVFSVGTNSYNHPSQEVVNSFIGNNYALRYTNPVGSLRVIEESRQAQLFSTILNSFSSVIQYEGKDCSFIIDTEQGQITEL